MNHPHPPLPKNKAFQLPKIAPERFADYFDTLDLKAISRDFEIKTLDKRGSSTLPMK
jgi:hypothetical protein